MHTIRAVRLSLNLSVKQYQTYEAKIKIQKGAWMFFEVLQRLMRNKDGEILSQILI